MGKKKEKPIDLENLTPEEELKLEIAAEIGVYDKVLNGGWRVLSAKESGRIGGLLSRRKRMLQNEDKTGEHASVDD
ncbi:small, acid-soluble spore protein, alpha/beta type [Hominifimenecus sp. rT4P-3]|uniref:small, acid-soluble spore protein, alpha/beta type n=1 Tax=Hominifimenecus sp. rT4P-3 TaxID=3242979 RepID=UPI003DA616CD